MRNSSSTLDAPQTLFDALADPTRRRLLERLAERVEPSSISELTESFPITRQAVTKHLALLEQAELVRSERRGRERHLEVHGRRDDLEKAYGFGPPFTDRW